MTRLEYLSVKLTFNLYLKHDLVGIHLISSGNSFQILTIWCAIERAENKESSWSSNVQMIVLSCLSVSINLSEKVRKRQRS